MFSLFADVVGPAHRPWTLGEIAIAVVIALALVAIVYIATKAMGVTIPQWLIQIVLVCVVAVVAVLAIKFILSV